MSEGGNRGSSDTIWVIFMFMAVIFAMMVLMDKFYWAFNAFYGAVAFVYVYPVGKMAEFMPFLMDIPIIGDLLFVPCVESVRVLSEGGFSYLEPGPFRAYVMSAAGRVAFLIYGPILLRAALTETNVHVDQFYRKKHSLESMIREQAKTFPVIRMFKSLNPIETPDLTPKDFASGAMRQMNSSAGGAGDLVSGTKVMLRASGFTRALNPEEWLVSNGLVLDPEEYHKLTSGLFPAEDRSFYFSKNWEDLSIASISEVLEDQLVNPWRGPEKLPHHLRALFAVMVMFYSYNRKGGDAMLADLGKMAERSALEGVRMSELIRNDEGMMATIGRMISSTEGQQMIHFGNGHAWVESALPTLLRRARFERGVFASASFIWLKREDRAAWYILNATGNDAVNIEAAGAMAHNRAELDFRSPLAVPHVYQAARSVLHDYLDCHPERLAARKRRSEGRREMDEQVRLMSEEARRSLSAEDMISVNANDRMSIDYADGGKS